MRSGWITNVFGVVLAWVSSTGCPAPGHSDVVQTRDAGTASDALDDLREASDVRDVSSERAPGPRFCELPIAAPDGITVPAGFCVRRFARVQHARVLRFAPGGELFVASPNTTTSGYGDPGPEPSRIAIIADDDGDGVGDAVQTFLPGLDSCHALLFTPGWFYFSSGTQIRRMVYATGQRTPAMSGLVANLTDFMSFTHWPHTLDAADDGTIYVSRGGDERSECPQPRPVHGAILEIDGSVRGRVVSRGLRNPMYVRCQRGFNHCYANELTGDFWDPIGGVEKLIEIHEGDDWGYPCCVTRDRPIPNAMPVPDCSAIATEEHSIRLHDTPFGLDFEPGNWPAPWHRAVFVAMHGAFVTWSGARILALATDPGTGSPQPPKLDFATGWDDGRRDRGRPSDVTFAPDGRLFIANDITGEIVWVAPVELRAPSR